MKKVISVFFLMFSLSAYAECPSSLPADKMTECIMVEGSGDKTYQDWSAAFETEGKLSKIVSPVTGEDVRNIKPASGTEQK